MVDIKRIGVLLLLVPIIFIMCSYNNEVSPIEERIRNKALIYIVNSIDTFGQRGSYTVEEFYYKNKRAVYCYMTRYATNIKRLSHPNFYYNKPVDWKSLPDNILKSAETGYCNKYDVILVSDSTNIPLDQRMDALNIRMRQPVKTDSCYYVSAHLSLSADESVSKWLIYEVVFYKFSLEGEIEESYHYMAVE